MIKVGFIGLGELGKPMAVNLAKNGFDLILHDLRREPVDELIAIGAKAAHSPRELAAASEVIEVAVVDEAQVEAVAARSRSRNYSIAAHCAEPSRRQLDKEQADSECDQVVVQGSHAGARVRRRARTRVAGNRDGARINRVN